MEKFPELSKVKTRSKGESMHRPLSEIVPLARSMDSDCVAADSPEGTKVYESLSMNLQIVDFGFSKVIQQNLQVQTFVQRLGHGSGR